MPGTITVCRNCLQPSVLEEDGSLRRMSDSDVVQLPLRHVMLLGFTIIGLREANERLKKLN